mgnify:CR=1 FL=1
MFPPRMDESSAMVKRASDPVGRPGKPMLIWFCSMALRLSVKAGV